MRLAEGFEITEDIDVSQVARPVEAKQRVDTKCTGPLLGRAAEAAVDAIEMSPPPQHASMILRKTKEEIEEGRAYPLMDRVALDNMFGRGQSRPMPRHVVEQNGEWRTIDDGKRSGTNALSNITESIVNVPPTILVILIRSMASAFQQAMATCLRTSSCERPLRIGGRDTANSFRRKSTLPSTLRRYTTPMQASGNIQFCADWPLASGQQSTSSPGCRP